MPYVNTGPFTNNTVPPGISATFLNNVENFLDTVNSAATDSNITSGGSGNLATTGTVQTANNKAFQSKDSGGTVRPLLTLDGSNNVIVKAGGNNRISLSTNSGTEIARVNASGLSLMSGVFSLLVGSIARIAFGFSAFTTGGTTITHGLGALPVVFMLPSTNVTCWASSTTTTTQFTGFVSSNTNCWWLCLA